MPSHAERERHNAQHDKRKPKVSRRTAMRTWFLLRAPLQERFIDRETEAD